LRHKRQALRVCGGGIVRVDFAGNGGH